MSDNKDLNISNEIKSFSKNALLTKTVSPHGETENIKNTGLLNDRVNINIVKKPKNLNIVSESQEKINSLPTYNILVTGEGNSNHKKINPNGQRKT